MGQAYPSPGVPCLRQARNFEGHPEDPDDYTGPVASCTSSLVCVPCMQLAYGPDCPRHPRAQPYRKLGREANVVQEEGFWVCFVLSWRSLKGFGKEKEADFDSSEPQSWLHG